METPASPPAPAPQANPLAPGVVGTWPRSWPSLLLSHLCPLHLRPAQPVSLTVLLADHSCGTSDSGALQSPGSWCSLSPAWPEPPCPPALSLWEEGTINSQQTWRGCLLTRTMAPGEAGAPVAPPLAPRAGMGSGPPNPSLVHRGRAGWCLLQMGKLSEMAEVGFDSRLVWLQQELCTCLLTAAPRSWEERHRAPGRRICPLQAPSVTAGAALGGAPWAPGLQCTAFSAADRHLTCPVAGGQSGSVSGSVSWGSPSVHVLSLPASLGAPNWTRPHLDPHPLPHPSQAPASPEMQLSPCPGCLPWSSSLALRKQKTGRAPPIRHQHLYHAGCHLLESCCTLPHRRGPQHPASASALGKAGTGPRGH